MVVALLVCLSGTVGNGLVGYGDMGKGRLAHTSGLVTTPAFTERDEVRSEGREGKGGESIVGELHSTLANITLGVIILHILGVGLASVMRRENLVAAMLTGRKRPGNEVSKTRPFGC